MLSPSSCGALAISSGVIGEDACVDVLTEACSFGFGLERLGSVAELLIALAVLPFSFVGEDIVDVWQAAEF
jgi:hypothetical protein